jgi:hypothetical protein
MDGWRGVGPIFKIVAADINGAVKVLDDAEFQPLAEFNLYKSDY